MGDGIPRQVWRLWAMFIFCIVQFACANPRTPHRYHTLPTDPPRALILAADFGDAELATLALHEGANVNARDDSSGLTPLMRAAGGQHDRVVKLLLDRGADATVRDTEGHTALWHAGGTAIHGYVPGVGGVDLYLRRPSSWLTASGQLIDQATRAKTGR